MAATNPQLQQTSAIDEITLGALSQATYGEEKEPVRVMELEETRQRLLYKHITDIDPTTNRTLRILIAEAEPAKLEEADLRRYAQPIYNRDALLEYMRREVKEAPRGTIKDSRKILRKIGVSLSELIIQERRA